MAITSEEVVLNGNQVVEHVNKLAEQMVVFQQRLDGIGGVFDTMQSSMDEAESDIQGAFTAALDFISGDAMTRAKEVGEVLENEVMSVSIAALDEAKNHLQTEFEKIDTSSTSLVARWDQWREDEMSVLITEFETRADESSEKFSELVNLANQSIDSMEQVANEYVGNSEQMSAQLTEFVTQSIELLNEEREKYSQNMLQEFTTDIQSTMTEGGINLTEIQDIATGKVFDEIGDDFSNHVKSEFLPLIDKVVAEVGSSVDEMMRDIAKIGDDSNEKGQSLDAVTGILEELISPIKSIIDRTQSIKNVVDAFI